MIGTKQKGEKKHLITTCLYAVWIRFNTITSHLARKLDDKVGLPYISGTRWRKWAGVIIVKKKKQFFSSEFHKKKLVKKKSS